MRRNLIIYIALIIVLFLIIIQIIIIPKLLFVNRNYYDNIIYNKNQIIDDNFKNLEFKKLELGDGIVTNIWLEKSKLDNLKNHNIKYLYVDIGETFLSGKIKTPESEIIHFLEIIEEFENKNNYEFVLLPYSDINTYKFEVDDEFVTNYIESYLRLYELGFDGIYIDIEPVRDKEYFLLIVKKVDEEFPEKAIIGLYSGTVFNGEISNNEWEWELSYFEKISRNVDLILIPSYDTDINDDDEYNFFVRNQVKMLLENDKIRTNLVYGVPVHKEGIEIIGNSFGSYLIEVKTYKENDGNNEKKGNFIGIGIFSEWTMDEGEWRVYEDLIGK